MLRNFSALLLVGVISACQAHRAGEYEAEQEQTHSRQETTQHATLREEQDMLSLAETNSIVDVKALTRRAWHVSAGDASGSCAVTFSPRLLSRDDTAKQSNTQNAPLSDEAEKQEKKQVKTLRTKPQSQTQPQPQSTNAVAALETAVEHLRIGVLDMRGCKSKQINDLAGWMVSGDKIELVDRERKVQAHVLMERPDLLLGYTNSGVDLILSHE
ncbi:hypothetical protein [Polycladidibacter stylochi]|uniref:hypothetical protein n=1 Tax=Polycladidibacter stylochi TaxID=1807766 RepID=UPI00083275A6|nr:hypothetical protein [Pseudovibrio stylochi]